MKLRKESNMSLVQQDRPYLTYRDNNLYDEDGTLFTDVYFTNVGQAEARLIEHDARGNIK